MRISSLFTLFIALVLAVFAGLLAQSWLESQRQTTQSLVVEKPIATAKIVVATQPLRFGTELSTANLKEIEWGTAALPAGAFTSMAELLNSTERRVVLSAIEPNEPILKWKITGPGQRASVSTLVKPGHKAVSVRVNDVFGVAGFVLPGDHVDVLLTRTEANNSDKKQFTEVLLQHARVLGIDQSADDRKDDPMVVKAVTLEVDMRDAQRLALAGTVGSLSLALRSAGATETVMTQRVSADDLGAPVFKALASAPEPSSTGKVGIRRGLLEPRLYNVPMESMARGWQFIRVMNQVTPAATETGMLTEGPGLPGVH